MQRARDIRLAQCKPISEVPARATVRVDLGRSAVSSLRCLRLCFSLRPCCSRSLRGSAPPSNLERTFTGPLARSLALVAIVIGGLMFMFGEAGAKRQISGIVFGGGLALFAAQFLAWLF